jgi:hypothetical protein
MAAEVTLKEATAAIDQFERDLLAWLRRQTRGHQGIEFGPRKQRSIKREVALQFSFAVPATVDAMREAARDEETFTR